MSYIPVELRKSVQDLAKAQCEYCLIPEENSYASFEIDHIIAQKHGGETVLDNLAYSCPICNKHKGSDIASYDSETEGLTPFYNPRKNNWQQHFDLTNDGYIAPKSAMGRVTVKLLQLNRAERVKERKTLLQFGFLMMLGERESNRLQ
ncbi:MAG: HNH endonuclease [Chloroflexi bacterium]|nr:MAG: HNH endonuclease [Chloroflexota bacterium]